MKNSSNIIKYTNLMTDFLRKTGSFLKNWFTNYALKNWFNIKIKRVHAICRNIKAFPRVIQLLYIRAYNPRNARNS